MYAGIINIPLFHEHLLAPHLVKEVEANLTASYPWGFTLHGQQDLSSIAVSNFLEAHDVAISVTLTIGQRLV